MANMIRVGSKYINLDRVTEIRPLVDHLGNPELRVFFGVDDCSTFGGPVEQALHAYLDGLAVDVVEVHRVVLKERQDAADRSAASNANYALLERCTGATGHSWELDDEEGWNCMECGAHCGLGWIDEVINCWGGIRCATPSPAETTP